MVTIVYMTFSCIFLKENISFLKFPANGPINNKSAFILVMARYGIDNKPLPETMLTQIYDAIYHHQ